MHVQALTQMMASALRGKSLKEEVLGRGGERPGARAALVAVLDATLAAGGPGAVMDSAWSKGPQYGAVLRQLVGE